jgi:hypothetical protein
MCQAVDNTSRNYTEDYIDMFCQLLRLSPVQSLSVAYALTQSMKRNLAADALQFMRKILPLVYGNPLADITEETLMAIVNFIVNNKVSIFFYLSSNWLNVLSGL